MESQTQTICQTPADRCCIWGGAERPQPPVSTPAPVPQFEGNSSPAQSFNISKAEQVIKDMLDAQRVEVVASANQAVSSFGGASNVRRTRLRQRKSSRPQRAEEDDIPARRSCISELAPRERGVSSKPSPSHKRRKGMSKAAVLQEMAKIVQFRMQKGRQLATKSSAFYKVYPVLFGH